ncbi:MAG: protease SohB, partial [Nevskiaceae bacterium]
MAEFFFQYGLFFAKALTWIAAIVIVATVLANLLHQLRARATDHLEVLNLNHRFRELADSLQHALLTPQEWKREQKAHKAEDKARKAGGTAARPRVFVL